MSAPKIYDVPHLPNVPPKVEKKVRDWHTIEAKSRHLVRQDTDEKDLLELRIAHKPLPGIMRTGIMNYAAVRAATAMVAPIAHAEYHAKTALQTELVKVRAQLHEHRATLTAATHHLDTLARGSEAVAALVNGLRQGTVLRGEPSVPARAGRVRFNEHVQILGEAQDE